MSQIDRRAFLATAAAAIAVSAACRAADTPREGGWTTRSAMPVACACGIDDQLQLHAAGLLS